MSNRYLLITMISLLLVLGFLQYRLWFEQTGLKHMLSLKATLRQQLTLNQKLKAENDALLAQINRLKNNKEAEEGQARNDLGMIKKGETFYQIVR